MDGPGQRFRRDADENERIVQKRFWPKVRRVARGVPFSYDAVAAYYCAMDPATPARVRATLLGALAYFVLPFDTVPDMLVGVGFTDDATVLLAALGMVQAHMLPRHRAAAEAALADDADVVG